MKSHHFDAIIFGNGPAVRIAAFLAGRRGRRILMCGDEQPATLPPALPYCGHLEKLLITLGADRSQLQAAGNLQLIGERHRLDLTGKLLDDEWRRELTTDCDHPARVLHKLDLAGAKLSRALTAIKPSALFSLRGQIRLAATGCKPLRDRLYLGASLSCFLDKHTDHEANNLLRDLFGGLSGLPVDMLSIAQAALLWHWSCLPKTFNNDAFLDLLSRRTKQFHVTEIPCTQIETLDWLGRRLQGICLRDGQNIRAGKFILASQDALSFFTVANKKRQQMLCATRPTWRTTPIRGQITAFLAERFVLAGAVPLLVTRCDFPEGIRFIIEAGVHNGKLPYTCKDIDQRLRPLLAFADFEVEEVCLPSRTRPHRGYIKLCGLPCSMPRHNLLIAIPEWLFPGLGINREILLGFALADQLIATAK